MSSKKTPAIVLGGGITGLSVIRNLGINGVDVYCVADQVDCAMYSKFCKKHFIIPHIQTNRALLKNFLQDIESTINSAVVFPTSDLFSLNLASIKNEISDTYFPVVPEAKTLRNIVKKDAFYKSLNAFDLPHPTTFYPKSIRDVEELSSTIQYPLIIKPVLSQVFYNKFRRKIFRAYSAQDLLNKFQLAVREHMPVIIQEIIPGPEDGNYSIVGCFEKNHNPNALFACHRLRGWPKDFGNSSYVESSSLSELKTIKDKIVQYLNKIGYYGVMEAEIKRDPRDGAFKLIEINARSWWQNSLPTNCGINIIYLAYLNSIGITTPYSEQYRIGIHWMYPLNDLQFFLRFRPEKLGAWFNSLRKTEDLAYFSKYDMSPWIVKNLLNIVILMESGFMRLASHNYLICV